MEYIRVDNVLSVPFNEIRKKMFKLIKLHYKLPVDKDLYYDLLGYYPALYNYLSEIYAFLVNHVRLNRGDLEAMSKRDMFEQLLKDVKFQYDSLSRKITLVTEEKELVL
ncbi:MAG: hypothetical protein ACTSR2_01385 [Candidatus Hodarchaeales archaeon]